MIEKAKSFVAMAQNCAAASVGSPVCDRFWSMTGVVAATIIAIILVTTLAMFLRSKARSRKAIALWEADMRREDEVAPELRIQHASWKGDAVAELDEKAMAAQIKQALQNRKINGRE